ncbi:hypothetical protein MCOR02_000570 [Pyricularia oryzae]|uniref:Uncharacterized protein n=2 Tax=Pyricularia TaxID=48558 RepID=A0ABQ8NEH1_PYRGI|nr:hypothetical protein MCOR01_009796 [Pyricularia oryzae]KAI6295308.1 hypothetical protein MCOR33_007756 [Pyricularia grisea]KAH9436906.1 hypothetical protein MCOR02_000570 [Pyricularia oryzae]KAI6276674.1 hypothetical protein MCOR26_005466 [Pyricularia oryzae]KAI6311089.1 hypothetical protein MCOR29_008379 [Pyricularia oryzae]
MLTVRSFFNLVVFLLLGVLSGGVEAQRKGGRRQTPQQQFAQVPQGVSKATDGSTILDMTAKVNGADLRFKISGPADQFTAASGVQGGAQQAGAEGNLGLNVLLHGDGGQSFLDFPNQAVQGNLMGVVVLAPSVNLLWGNRQGQPAGNDRPDGVADAQAVNDLILDVLPQMVAFNKSNVFFTGVSGGSLTLSGFFMPAHLTNFKGNGVLLDCGALPPAVDFKDAAATLSTTKIHFQSSQRELSSLQQSIPQAIQAYEKLASDAGLNTDQINALQTVDATPNGGHCAFDGKDFVSGIQLVADNYKNIMQGGDGAVKGINVATVLKGVVGNENPFGRGRGAAAAGAAAGGATGAGKQTGRTAKQASRLAAARLNARALGQLDQN